MGSGKTIEKTCTLGLKTPFLARVVMGWVFDSIRTWWTLKIDSKGNCILRSIPVLSKILGSCNDDEWNKEVWVLLVEFKGEEVEV